MLSEQKNNVCGRVQGFELPISCVMLQFLLPDGCYVRALCVSIGEAVLSLSHGPATGGGGSDWSVWGQPGLGHLAFRSLVGGGVADQRHRVLVLSAELWFEDCGTTFGI